MGTSAASYRLAAWPGHASLDRRRNPAARFAQGPNVQSCGVTTPGAAVGLAPGDELLATAPAWSPSSTAPLKRCLGFAGLTARIFAQVADHEVHLVPLALSKGAMPTAAAATSSIQVPFVFSLQV